MSCPRLIACAALGAALAGCQTVPQASGERLGSAQLHLADGAPVGTAELFGQGPALTISIALRGLPPGVHGVHLHMVGKCEGPGFTSAGGHLNPGGHQHGTENPAGAHLGDLPNVTIAADGRGAVQATLPGARDANLAAIFDADGTAVVVHAMPDDYRTDPAGNAGARIACGVLGRG
jgi:Cu-Zn family superoxide dismutase